MGFFLELNRSLNLLFTKIVLSQRIRKRADRYYNRTLKEFRKKHHRKPDRNESFLLVVKTRHRVLGVKIAGGSKGHIKRQWVTKYLLLKNRIRDSFKIQKSKK